MAHRLPPCGWAWGLVWLVALGVAAPAVRADEGAPASPAPTAGARDARVDAAVPSDPGVPPPPAENWTYGVGGAEGPAPDVRPRPPEPPPPAGGDWDKDFRSRGVGLGPPLPPPDWFQPRPLLWRHDAREVSLDARVKAVKRVPQWVDVVERRDIVEWRPMDLGDLARRLPNVIVADGGSPFLQVPVIRGLGGQRVKVLTDGVWPATDVLGIQGSTLSLWDPESTERMEVYHGPGVYLKGIDAPGGLVNLVPRRPRRHGCLSADVGGAVAYDSATRAFRGRAEADVGQGRLAGLVGFTWTARGDRRLADGDDLDPTSYDQVAADLALDYFIDNRSRVGITAQYVKAYDVQSPYSVASGITQPSLERFFLALTLTSFDAGGLFSGTRASIALDTLLSDRDDAFEGFSTGIGGQDDAQRYQLNLQGNLYLHPCHDTYAELTVAYAHLDRTERIFGDCAACCGDETVGPGPNDVPGGPTAGPLAARLPGGSPFADLPTCAGLIRSFEAEEIVASLLVEDQTHSACWDTHLGVRVDLYHVEDNRVGSSETQVLVGGAGGVARHLSPCLTAYANASGGWRRPTLDERYSMAVVDGVTLLGDPDLDPELTINGEVGVKGSVKNRLSWQVAGFGHYLDDFIGPVDTVDLIGPTAVLRNVGDVFLYGGELTAAWRPWNTLEGTELYGSLGVTRSSDVDVVADVPFLWRAGARYSVPQPRGYRIRRWFADAALYGATDSRDGVRGGDAFVTGEVVVGTGLDLGSWRKALLHVGVTNLFDADYVPPASRLPAPGLGLFANLGVDL